MRTRILLFPLLFCVGVYSTPNSAATEFGICEVYSNPDLRTLQILQMHGIDPTQISFKFKIETTSYEGSQQLDFSGNLTLKLNQENLGYLSFDPRALGQINVTDVGAYLGQEALFENKGLGRLLYLLSAKLIFEKTGLALRSDVYNSVRRRPFRLWMRLVDEEIAQYVGDQYSLYQFAPGALSGSGEMESLLEFFRPRIQVEATETVIRK